MSAPSDVLLVSCANRKGGVFLLDAMRVDRLSSVETTGICAVPGGLLWARQSGDSNQLRWIRGGELKVVTLADEPLDLHDVRWHDGDVYAVATECNAVLRLDAELREVERWTLPGERDSAHLNSICFHGGRLLATRFGEFRTHREYKAAPNGAGEIFDVVSGEVLVSGLSQPHSLTSCDGILWVCDSGTRTLRAFRDSGQIAEHAFEGYVRGLAFSREYAYVGLSRSRNAEPATLECARLVTMDRATMGRVAAIDLPADEIYDIHLFGGDEAALRNAAFAEASAELAAVGEQLEHLRSELAERDSRLGAMNERLREAAELRAASDAKMLELRSRLAERDVALSDIDADAREKAHWIAMLEPDRDAWRSTARVMRGSRSWRITRPLRKASELLGRPAEIAMPDDGDGPSGSQADRGVRHSQVPIYGLEFAEADAPQVSIVVTSHGQFAHTLACLRAVRRGLGDSCDVEVLLIEDASGDPEMERFDSVPGLRFHANRENLGFLKSANQALTLARGDFLHFLNNDTLVRPGWLDSLVETFALLPDCGLAGSKLIYPDGTLQEAGAVIWSDGTGCNVGRAGNPGDARYRYAREVDYVSGASMLVRAEVFRRLGGFDERYAPAYYEDTDLAFRIRSLGHKVYYQPASVVVHHEGLSHGTDITGNGKANQETNRARFTERWRETLVREQLEPGAHMFLARERGQLKKTVLVVDRHPPRTDHDAGSRAIWQLMRVLQLRNMAIKFWAQDVEDAGPYADALRSHGIELLPGGGAESFEAWIAEHGRYVDYAILSRPTVAAAHIEPLRRHSHAEVVYYGHDIHHLRFLSQMHVDPDPDIAGHAHHSRVIEEDLWRRSDLILYPADSETDHVRQWLRAENVAGKAATIPLFAYEPTAIEVGEGLQHRLNILFVGGFAHSPNEDGAAWFARTIWPLVHRRHPLLRLCLVGADPPDRIVALGRSDVIVTGQIPEQELLAYYHSARVVVAPLRYGAGVKGKVLEAMRHGVPCVTTSIGAQGLRDADCLRVTDDPATFARHIDELVRDDEAWLSSARRGIAFIDQHFSVDSVWRVLSGTIDPAPYADVASRLRRVMSRARGHED